MLQHYFIFHHHLYNNCKMNKFLTVLDIFAKCNSESYVISVADLIIIIMIIEC